jgi:hypothetical protein
MLGAKSLFLSTQSSLLRRSNILGQDIDISGYAAGKLVSACSSEKIRSKAIITSYSTMDETLAAYRENQGDRYPPLLWCTGDTYPGDIGTVSEPTLAVNSKPCPASLLGFCAIVLASIYSHLAGELF